MPNWSGDARAEAPPPGAFGAGIVDDAYLDAVASGALPPGYGVDDGVGLLFRGTRLAEVIIGHSGLLG